MKDEGKLKNADGTPGCPDWLPTEVPCIPVFARNPISFIVCMLTSFYGKGAYNKLFAGMNIDKKYIEEIKNLL